MWFELYYIAHVYNYHITKFHVSYIFNIQWTWTIQNSTHNSTQFKNTDMQSQSFYLLKLKMTFKKIKYITEREIITNETINKLMNVFQKCYH